MKHNFGIQLTAALLLFFISSATAQYSDYHSIEYSSMKTSLELFDDLFCHVSDRYILVEGSNNEVRIHTFSEEGNLITTKEIGEIGEFKNLRFYGAKAVNESILIYFMARDVSTTKGKRGLYSVVFSIDGNSLETPVLIDEFESKTTPDIVLIIQSLNREYTAFIVDPKTYCKIYSYDLIVLNRSGEKVTTIYNAQGEFDDCYEFAEANISDEGMVYLTYKEFVNFAGGVKAFLEPSSRTAWIRHNPGGEKQLTYFMDPAKSILQFRLISYSGAEVYFFSWFSLEDHSKVGISFLDPETKIENVIYEFNPGFLEPFIERNGADDRFREDSIRKNALSDSKVNAHIDLINIFYVNGEEYLLLEKRTPVRIKVVRGESTVSIFMDVEGDLFLLNTKTASIQKTERLVASRSTPRGVYSIVNNNTISCFYYSLPPGEKENFSVDDPARQLFLGYPRPEDLYLYRSDFSLEDESVVQEELQPQAGQLNYLIISVQRAFYEQGNLRAIGSLDKIKQVVSLPVD